MMKRVLSVFLILTLIMACVPALASDALTRELKVGDSGEDVLALQKRLTELQYYLGALDGVFGDELANALALFQLCEGLSRQDGVLDEETHGALFDANAQSYPEALAHMYQIDAPVEAAPDSLFEAAPNLGMPMLAADMSAPVASMSMYDAKFNTNEYGLIRENGFQSVAASPLSTFAADVDTASYAEVRAMILRGETVPADSVRIEEMLNYFKYDYAAPAAGEPLGVTAEMTDCPWNAQTRLLLIGLEAERIARGDLPAQNLVFLIDVSGSMDAPNKLPLVKRAFLLLLEELAPTDTVSIVTYASRDEVVLDGVRASDKTTIMEAVENLSAYGSTAGAAGIQTAYELAEKHSIPGGSNRILLATDGDLNVGISDEGSLARLVATKRDSGVFLSVLGFGDGNYKDNKLEALADNGNGNYAYIDTIYEARRALVTEIGATFVTVAKDVKLQLDFNPAKIKGYRLIGYENRLMNAEDFADDAKDGGELGSGHRVTVLYEIVPADSAFAFDGVQSKYQSAPGGGESDEWLTLSIRAKAPDGDESSLYAYPLTESICTVSPSENLRFAAAVAEVGMLLRDSEWKGTATYDSALTLLRGLTTLVGDPYKEEFLYLTTLLARAAK